MKVESFWSHILSKGTSDDGAKGSGSGRSLSRDGWDPLPTLRNPSFLIKTRP